MRLYALTTAGLMLSLGITSCSDHGKTSAEPASEETRGVQMKLQSSDGGFLLGLEGTVEVRQDLSGDAGAPCSVMSDVVATEDTSQDDEFLPFALTVGDYCFSLLDGWTLYYNTSNDASVNWQAIASGDVDHTTDPHPVPVPITQSSSGIVTFTFDWVPPAIDEDYGVSNVDIVVDTNACSGVCGTDAGAATQCAVLNDAPAACYPSCDINDDCENLCPLGVGGTDGLCLRGNIPMADPGICVCL